MKKVACILLALECFLSGKAYASDKDVLQQVYTVVQDNYIEKIPLSKLFIPAFSSLSKIDKNLKVVHEKKSVTIYYENKIHKVYSRPKDDASAEEWAKYTSWLLEEVKQLSPELRRKDFELVEVMLHDAVSAIDKYSRYYPTLEIGQKQAKIQGYLASLWKDNILYIRLGTINDFTTESFQKTIEKYKQVSGIILDLRGNKGGYLKQALDIADMFLDSGRVIYTTGKNPGKRKVYNTIKGAIYSDVPMVVLVDGQTASAAEVLTLALKERGRAKIVGAQTYGKATVQNIYKLENEAHLALTTERFVSARQVDIEDIGIRPYVCSEVFETTSNIDEVIDYHYNFVCPKLSRNSSFETDVAQRILQREIEKKKTAPET